MLDGKETVVPPSSRPFIHDAGGETMVRAVVALSHSLGMRAVAEGVEDHEQALALERLGCTMAQGYLFARPMAPNAMTQALQTSNERTSAGGAR